MGRGSGIGCAVTCPEKDMSTTIKIVVPYRIGTIKHAVRCGIAEDSQRIQKHLENVY